MPKDYREWYKLMDIEFGQRFSKLFRGPAWSGCEQKDYHDPMKAKMNVAAVGHVAITRDLRKSAYTTTTEIQEAALKDLKEANPNGRFWIKLDATDIKPAIQESVKGRWAGDADIGDGKLQELRAEYDERLEQLQDINTLSSKLTFKEDIKFLSLELQEASDIYNQKFADDTTSSEKLKCLNWEVVELATLLQQSQQFEASCNQLKTETDERTHQVLTGLLPDLKIYLRNLFKKKRQPAATHVLVIMLSEEQRKTKPYALPVQFIPYRGLKDTEVRVFTARLKQKMAEMSMECIGTVTDGEFSTLRTAGEDGTPTHISGLIKQARSSVSTRAESTLKKMLIKTGETAEGVAMTATPSNVPASVLDRLANMMEFLSFSDALSIIRNELPPMTWVAYKVEDEHQMMKSIIATYQFRHLIASHKSQGRDFSKHMYIPATDPVTGKPHKEQEDHNHIVKRIAKHVREGHVPDVDYGRFQKAVDAEVITEAVLLGLRKQSVGDAERFLSFAVADFFLKEGYLGEEKFVRTVARWHEAADGRGMSQSERRQANAAMMDMLLFEWVPDYDPNNRDLSQIDINIKITGLMGFSRETVIGVSSNIDSQELRRGENDRFGPEHPRAGTTDDVECYFGLLHRVTKGNQCTLKEFKYWWQKLIIQFSARINVDLPFYVWTLADTYSMEDQPSFDAVPDNETNESGHILTRLHRLGHRSREMSGVTIGRNTIAAAHSTTVRRSVFSRPIPNPSVPHAVQVATDAIVQAVMAMAMVNNR